VSTLEPRIRVLMVCLGNICRSPLAEGVMKHMAKKKGVHERLLVHSAGTADYHVGDPPDPRSHKVAMMNGFELDHEGRHFKPSDFSSYDFILVMDDSNFRDVISLAKSDEHRQKVRLITEYDHGQKYGKKVPDPYYGDLDDFIAVYEQLRHCCEGFFQKVLSQSSR
jgi:protein-tyrosine phosphatase